MKRISISATVIVLVIACAAQARIQYYGYSQNRSRVRWSTYAGGLISGDVYYSPYAFGHGHSALVPGNVRYSPYAFGFGRSGLVVESATDYYGGLHAVRYYPHDFCAARFYSDRKSGAGRSYEMPYVAFPQKVSKETAETRNAGRTQMTLARRRAPSSGSNEGWQIIAGYLKSRNIDFKTTRILSIEGATVSIDFVLDGGDTVIKYWDPEELRSLGQSEGRKREFYDKYVKSWFGFCQEHLKAGGRIHQIISSDSNEILAKLSSCPDLNGDGKVYAAAANPGQ